MREVKETVKSIIDEHAVKVQANQYDRHIAVSAVASARKRVDELQLETVPADKQARTVIDALIQLRLEYSDPDGEYTNGKAILGNLIDDVFLALSPQDDSAIGEK